MVIKRPYSRKYGYYIREVTFVTPLNEASVYGDTDCGWSDLDDFIKHIKHSPFS